MADRYWVNDGADGLWNNADNWSATDGGAGGAGVPIAADAVYFSASCVDNCTLNVNVSVASIVFNVVLSKYTGQFDADIYDVATTGNFGSRVAMTLRMGSGAWSIGGSFTARDNTFWGETATVTMTGSGVTYTGSNTTSDNGPSLVINASGTVTISIISGFFAELVLTAGTLVLSVNSRLFGDLAVGAGTTLTVNATLYFYATTGKTITTFGAGATINGSTNLYWYRVGAGVYTIPAGTYDCALTMVSDGAATGCTIRPLGDCTFNKTWTITQRDSADVVTWDNGTNNPNLTFNGDIAVTMADGTLAWTKGTGTIKFTGAANQAVNLFDKTVEDIVFEKSAGTVTFTNGWTADSFTMGGASDASTLAFNVTGATLTTTGDWTIGANGQVDPTNLDGWTWSVGGNLSLAGDAVAKLNLVATAAWTLTVTGTAIATYVDVAYSDADAGTAIDADDGTNTDSGNNLGWTFPAAFNPSSSVWHPQIHQPLRDTLVPIPY